MLSYGAVRAWCDLCKQDPLSTSQVDVYTQAGHLKNNSYKRQQTLIQWLCECVCLLPTGLSFLPNINKKRKKITKNFICATLWMVNNETKAGQELTQQNPNRHHQQRKIIIIFNNIFVSPSKKHSKALRCHEFFAQSWQLISFVITSFMLPSTVLIWLKRKEKRLNGMKFWRGWLWNVVFKYLAIC